MNSVRCHASLGGLGSLVVWFALSLALLFGGTATTATAATAATPKAAALTAEDRADLLRIEAWLEDVTTLNAGFIQRSSRGEVSEGTLLLSRPGRMRFEYNPPPEILIVANASSLIYVDYELEQVSYLPLSSSPLAALIDAEVRLTERYDVRAVERGPGTLSVVLGVKGDPDAGAVRLIFTDRPLALRQWQLRDAQGVEIQVTLLNPRRGGEIDPEMFRVSPLLFDKPRQEP